MWRVTETSSRQKLWLSLTKQRADYVKDTSQEMGPARQSRWSDGVQDRTFWDGDLDKVVGAIIDNGRRIL